MYRKSLHAAKQDDCSRLQYGYVNNKLPPFSFAILVLPLPDTNGVTLLLLLLFFF